LQGAPGDHRLGLTIALVRAGVDETIKVHPADFRFVFQGVSDAEYRGQGYGGIPWRLGMLERR